MQLQPCWPANLPFGFCAVLPLMILIIREVVIWCCGVWGWSLSFPWEPQFLSCLWFCTIPTLPLRCVNLDTLSPNMMLAGCSAELTRRCSHLLDIWNHWVRNSWRSMWGDLRHIGWPSSTSSVPYPPFNHYPALMRPSYIISSSSPYRATQLLEQFCSTISQPQVCLTQSEWHLLSTIHQESRSNTTVWTSNIAYCRANFDSLSDLNYIYRLWFSPNLPTHNVDYYSGCCCMQKENMTPM